MKNLIANLACLILLLGAAPAQAILLAFTPSFQTVASGSLATVSLSIAGLDGSATALGGFDLDLGFNPAILSLRGVRFGDPSLGDQLDLGGSSALICSSGYDTSPSCPADLTGGVVNLLELSLDAPDVLNALQADNFVLATFSFNTLSPGQSALSVVRLELADAYGDLLIADIQPGGITVSAPNAIPTPSSLALFVIGMTMLSLCNRKQLRLPRRVDHTKGAGEIILPGRTFQATIYGQACN
ncbi:MAG: cohesin domain-containing protein [Rhodoferax sp.]|uniref:cohesin domain-containing protein n=1 Tax=Rhodoferax sp. TaxID=50421 RepID=UPI0027255D4C|nr:cohesin domain-containing protein [Rhodoferax sp.]MDO8448384.1 cohesin domain-containing protein [Rhodoferax sp.]